MLSGQSNLALTRGGVWKPRKSRRKPPVTNPWRNLANISEPEVSEPEQRRLRCIGCSPGLRGVFILSCDDSTHTSLVPRRLAFALTVCIVGWAVGRVRALWNLTKQRHVEELFTASLQRSRAPERAPTTAISRRRFAACHWRALPRSLLESGPSVPAERRMSTRSFSEPLLSLTRHVSWAGMYGLEDHKPPIFSVVFTSSGRRGQAAAPRFCALFTRHCLK